MSVETIEIILAQKRCEDCVWYNAIFERCDISMEHREMMDDICDDFKSNDEEEEK